MPYAINGKISQEPIEGGIKISDSQYAAALEGMLSGLVVSIDNGFSIDLVPEPVDPVPDPIETELTLKDYDNALMNLFDVTAQSMNYQSWQTCAMRAYKPGPFELECTAFFDWMESCNSLGYQILADVNSGSREQPTIEAFIAGLPTFTRPVKE